MNVRPSAIILRDNSILTLCYCYSGTDVFALPGGNPDPGENLSQALARELEEELGIHAEVKEMVCCGEVIWPEVQKETLHIVFQADIGDQNPVLNPEQTTALKMVWLPLEELPEKRLYPNIGKQVADFLKGNMINAHIGVIDQPYIS
ncbi:NUDIX domain-containing protein [Dyadobacter crusticola]|uniref:NUDIX domain-containing protein n=1 Tax=Dyadobacter crusticola TaxID=292407 RepID=UPI0004E19B31|nr:NUDIX domain-containing protein [Dyadobacter crusticola]